MNIYTKNGDAGMTTRLDGTPIAKSSTQLELQGSIDEINSALGHLRSLIAIAGTPKDKELIFRNLDQNLKSIQHRLFLMGSDISLSLSQSSMSQEDTLYLEKAIDDMLLATGELHSFLYLSGHNTATWCHVLRTMTRRAERIFVRWMEETDTLKSVPEDYRFINRLSDYFFQSARYLNWLFGVEEETISP